MPTEAPHSHVISTRHVLRALCAALVASVCALAVLAAPASAVAIPSSFFTVKDQHGANDHPSQGDLTQMGRDDSDGSMYKLFWSWDATHFASQRGDACALFDSDADGNINQVVCVQISNPSSSPSVVTQTAGSPYRFTCSDARNDRCHQAAGPIAIGTNVQAGALSPNRTTPVAGANLVTDTDPFPSSNPHPDQNFPNDSTIEVLIAKLLVGNAELVNVCSYNSAGSGGNTDPVDCVISPGGGLLRIKKTAPTGATQSFAFAAASKATGSPDIAAAASVTANGQSDPIGLYIGTNNAVTETVPSGWTLDSATCKDSAGAATGTLNSTTKTVSGIKIDSGKVTTCEFANLAKPALTVVKDNDANQDGVFTDTETVPSNATYPYTVTYKATITNASASSPATISSIVDNKVAAPLTTANGLLTSCASLIGTTIGTGDTKTCYFDAAPFQNANSSQVVNALTVGASNAAGTDSKNDTATVNFAPSPAIDLVKSATPNFSTPPKPGDTITYSFSIKNAGNVTLTGVQLTDTLVGLSGAPCGTVTELAPGASTTCSRSHSLTQADINAGVRTNTASAQGSPPSGPAVTDTDGTTTPITRAPSVDLEKKATSSFSRPPKPGDTITYAFTIKNTGNVSLSDVQLSDPLVGLSGATCDGVTALSPGAWTTCTKSYTLTQADIDAGERKNTATAQGSPSSGPAVTDTDGTTTAITRTPSLDLEKTATPSLSTPPKSGDTISYSFSIKNTGNVTLTGVQLTDALVGLNGSKCDGVSTLAPDASTTCTAPYTLTQADIDAGERKNTASVKGSPPSGDDVTDTAGASVTLDAVPLVVLVKSATPDFGGDNIPQAGEKIAYGFKITNTGNVTLSGVDLTDQLVGYTDQTCEKTSLAPLESANCTASYTLTQADVDRGEIENTATACGDSPKAVEVCDEDSITTALKADPRVSLAKSVTEKAFGAGDVPHAGEKITYSFTITNAGNVTLGDVQLSDALVGLSGSTCDNVSSLAPKASTTCTATYALEQSDLDAGKVDNTATAKGTPPVGVPVESTDSQSVRLAADPRIALVKSVTDKAFDTDGTPQAGETVTYSFEISNPGNVTLDAVRLSDALVGLDKAVCGALGSLAPADTTTCTAVYKLKQSDIDNGKVDNTATAKGTPPVGDPVESTDSKSVALAADPQIKLVKSIADATFGDDKTPQAGETVEYSFAISNPGNVTLKAVELSDALVGMSGATCDNVSSLAPASSTTCSATYKLKQGDLDAGKVDNTATAKGNPPVGAAVESTDSQSVALPTDPRIALVKSVSAKDFGTDFVPQAGEKVEYSFDISNDGNVTLDDVKLSDALVGLSGAECGGVSELAPLGSTTCSATYTLKQSDIDNGKVDNTATATGNPPVGDPVQSTDSKSVTLKADPGIALVKTVTDEAFGADNVPQAGEKVGYSFAISNAGNVTLKGVALSDALVGMSGATCGGVSELAPVGSTTCSAVYTLKQSDLDAGKVDNTATATGNPPVGIPVESTDSKSVVLTAAPLALIVKSATPDFGGDGIPQAGETVGYGFTISNPGNVTLSSVDLTDRLIGYTDRTCEKTSLPPGGSAACTASYTLTQADIDRGGITNTATACGESPTAVEVCDSDSVTTTLKADPRVSLVKSVTDKAFGADNVPQAGEKVTYSFKIANTGNVTLGTVQLSDALVALDKAVCNGVATLAPGADATCTATYTLKQSDVDAGKVDNTATAKGTPPVGAPVESTDSVSVPLSAAPLSVLVKSATPDFGADGIPQAGEKVGYGFKITNTGNVTLSGVDLTDKLVGYTDQRCEKAVLVPGESANCTASYTLTQADVDKGELRNSATACGNPPAGAETCDSDSVTTTLKAAPAIDLDKKAAPDFGSTPEAGDTIAYAFVIANTGNVTLSGVQLTDVLVGLDQASCGGVSSLAPGKSTTCTATHALEQADVDAGERANTATAKGTPPTGGAVEDTARTSTPIDREPGLELTKRAAPETYSAAGDVITYAYGLKNTGNVTLTGPFQIADDKIPGPITCGTPDSTLAPAATFSGTCTADYTVRSGDLNSAGTGSVTNEATATAKDPKGSAVTSNKASATVRQVLKPAPLTVSGVPTPKQEVKSVVAASPRPKRGKAKLQSPTGCRSQAFKARVTGDQIASVTFMVDGKRVAKVGKVSKSGAWELAVRPKGYEFGTHRLLAKVTFTAASQTKAKRLTRTFIRCGRPAAKPQFTG